MQRKTTVNFSDGSCVTDITGDQARRCGLSFFFERREMEKIVKDEVCLVNRILARLSRFRGVSSIRLKRKREGKGVRCTLRHLIRIPARHGDKSPLPKFARILAFALLVFASRAFERTSASVLSFSIVHLSQLRVATRILLWSSCFLRQATDSYKKRATSLFCFCFLYPFI